MERLALETGTMVVLTDPLIASRPVSVTSEPLPMQEAIERILDGSSYALYPVAKAYAVMVLSTPPSQRQGNLWIAKAAVVSTDESPVHCGKVPVVGQPNPVVATTSRDVAVPQSLDEFCPIESEEGSITPMHRRLSILSPSMAPTKKANTMRRCCNRPWMRCSPSTRT